MRTAMAPLSRTLSVVLVGMVQASATWGPVRTAERSVTGTGRSREGGRGAPGIPHPARAERAARRIAIGASLPGPQVRGTWGTH